MRLSKLTCFCQSLLLPVGGGARPNAAARTPSPAVFPGSPTAGDAAKERGPRQLVATLDGEGPEGREAWQVHLRLLGRPRGLSFSREWSVYFLIDVLFHLALVWNSRWGCNYCNLGNKHFS